MSRIRATGNRNTELRLIDLLRKHRITGWRRKAKLFGKPDLVFSKARVAVFVDGCFWHRHPRCKFAYTPKARAEFWLTKFQHNVARDKVVTYTLRRAGWCVCGSAISIRGAPRERRDVSLGLLVGRRRGPRPRDHSGDVPFDFAPDLRRGFGRASSTDSLKKVEGLTRLHMVTAWQGVESVKLRGSHAPLRS
jgi:DNA mismatch endonuclease (patch repair protein)